MTAGEIGVDYLLLRRAAARWLAARARPDLGARVLVGRRSSRRRARPMRRRSRTSRRSPRRAQEFRGAGGGRLRPSRRPRRGARGRARDARPGRRRARPAGGGVSVSAGRPSRRLALRSRRAADGARRDLGVGAGAGLGRRRRLRRRRRCLTAPALTQPVETNQFRDTTLDAPPPRGDELVGRSRSRLRRLSARLLSHGLHRATQLLERRAGQRAAMTLLGELYAQGSASRRIPAAPKMIRASRRARGEPNPPFRSWR